MTKIEIDLTKEIEKIIAIEVEKRLDNIGILGFIRNCIKTEFRNSGCYSQLKRHESMLAQLKRKK